jgi:hypothetical protein
MHRRGARLAAAPAPTTRAAGCYRGGKSDQVRGDIHSRARQAQRGPHLAQGLRSLLRIGTGVRHRHARNVLAAPSTHIRILHQQSGVAIRARAARRAPQAGLARRLKLGAGVDSGRGRRLHSRGVVRAPPPPARRPARATAPRAAPTLIALPCAPRGPAAGLRRAVLAVRALLRFWTHRRHGFWPPRPAGGAAASRRWRSDAPYGSALWLICVFCARAPCARLRRPAVRTLMWLPVPLPVPQADAGPARRRLLVHVRRSLRRGLWCERGINRWHPLQRTVCARALDAQAVG